MAEGRFHLRGVLLPDGDAPVDLWVAAGRVSLSPLDGAEPLGPPPAFILPGLVDSHAHLTLDSGRKGLPSGSAELVAANRRDHLAAGVLALRDIGAVSDETLRGRRDGDRPLVHPAGRFLAPEGGYTGGQQAMPAEGLAEAAAAHARAGAEWVKVIADWPVGGAPDRLPELHRGRVNYTVADLRPAVEAAHRAGARLAVHAITREAVVLGIEAGVDSIEHALDADEGLVRSMAARSIAWVPTLSSFQATQRSAARRGQDDLANWLQERFERLRTLLPLARRLGITVLAGTDVLPPGTIAREVAALQQSGLSPREALAAASTAARAYLGEPELRDGVPADIVLYAADPRDDPEVLSRPAAILAAGVLLAPAS